MDFVFDLVYGFQYLLGFVGVGGIGLFFQGAQTLGGTADIVVDSVISLHHVAGGLTIGPGITLRTGTSSGSIHGSGESPLVLQGTVSAQTSGQYFQVHGTTFTNEGLLEAKNGGAI
ncbi:hypothetical protein LCGC14_1312900, partial [marine sediment metagenome]